MKKKLIAILSTVGLATQLGHEVRSIEDLNSYIESEMLNKSTVKIVEIAKENEKSKSEDNLNKYIKLTKSKSIKLKKSDAIKVDSSELKMTSFPDDYFVSMNLDLIKKARKSEKELSNVIDDIKSKQEEHKRLEEERKQEEARRREQARRQAVQSSGNKRSHQSNTSSRGESSGGGSRNPQSSGSTQRSGGATQRPASNIPIGVTYGAPTSSQLSASERARRENLVYSTLNRLPASSRAGVKEVRPVSRIQDGTYAGMTYWPTGVIEVALNWNDAIIIDTVIHEVGHTFHYKYGYHYSDEWEQIFAEEWAGKGYYGSINKREAFAETFKIIYSPNHSTSQARSVIPKSIDYVLSKT